MKILALTILFILMLFRIKGTPSALSKTLWRKRMIKQLAKNKENNNGELPNDTLQGATILTVFFMELFLIIFYIVLGNKIGTTEFIVMSALQVFTCLWSLGVNLSEVKTAFSYNIEDFKFHRFQLLFNVVRLYLLSVGDLHVIKITRSHYFITILGDESMRKWLVKRPYDEVIVTIMKNKSDGTYSFINLTKEHICSCRFSSVEEALLDIDKKDRRRNCIKI